MSEDAGEARLEAAMARCGASVLRLAVAQTECRADAEDVYQEVFLRYWRSAPDFASEEHERAWLLRVTANCAHSLHRARRRGATVELTDEIPDHAEAADLAAAELRELLRAIPASYRAVVHLHYFEGFSTKQIAQVLGRREGTVRMQLTRARRLLREAVGEDNILCEPE